MTLHICQDSGISPSVPQHFRNDQEESSTHGKMGHKDMDRGDEGYQRTPA